MLRCCGAVRRMLQTTEAPDGRTMPRGWLVQLEMLWREPSRLSDDSTRLSFSMGEWMEGLAWRR